MILEGVGKCESLDSIALCRRALDNFYYGGTANNLSVFNWSFDKKCHNGLHGRTAVQDSWGCYRNLTLLSQSDVIFTMVYGESKLFTWPDVFQGDVGFEFLQYSNPVSGVFVSNDYKKYKKMVTECPVMVGRYAYYIYILTRDSIPRDSYKIYIPTHKRFMIIGKIQEYNEFRDQGLDEPMDLLMHKIHQFGMEYAVVNREELPPIECKTPNSSVHQYQDVFVLGDYDRFTQDSSQGTITTISPIFGSLAEY